ncbi:hypothetical protein J5F27_02750 [Schleiferilactobacillus harbinensis]|uniref:hypothetical protein n=1 Tax=Schleiferilactobacillus harbinensis TaxID=304207 RepID=UPI001AAEC928|nr:hypothetical protein [Schleiferilactobacillus harbinensis]MBO3090837.1 hypothetical protein [Schleiferilactobacillus harbinensis]
MDKFKKGDWVRYNGKAFPKYRGKTYQIEDTDWPAEGWIDLTLPGKTILGDEPEAVSWGNGFMAQGFEVEKVEAPDETNH